MPSEEILLFIENIKQYVNSLYEEHPNYIFNTFIIIYKLVYG